jgi:hypothetical protein
MGARPWHYALLLLIHIHFFESGQKAAARDMLDVFYPWADAVRLSILKYHQFPWWNPWAMSGQPLFADPASVAVFMPDTLLVLAFGPVLGLKLAIIFYVLAGYEGSRVLCRHLFGRSPFVEAVSVIPIIIPALALHFNEGHVIFVIFYLFPWLLLLALTWERSALRSVAFGAVIGCYLISYIHYTVIMAFSIVGPVVLFRFRRFLTSRGAWTKAALVVCTALGMSVMRLGVTLTVIAQFPRTDMSHYPIVASISEVFGTLVEPFQDRNTAGNIAQLGWWELGSYVGLPVLLLAYEGFRRDGRRLWSLYAGAALCLFLAWNNRDKMFPSYWLHFIPPWKSMLVITRWSLFASFFLLLGAVHGLVAVRKAGHPRVAAALALLVVCDLGFHSYYAYRNTFAADPPPYSDMRGPPQTIYDSHEQAWAHERMNLVSMGAVCSLVGYGLHPPARQHLGSPGYAGDFVGTKPVAVESWSPNRFVLRATPGDTVTLNINPSSYWAMNGKQLFRTYRAFEIEKPFQVTVPASGRMEFVASDPNWKKFAAAQALCAALAVLLFVGLTKRASMRSRAPKGPRTAPVRRAFFGLMV